MRIVMSCAFIAALGMFPAFAQPGTAQPANPALPTLFLIGDSTVRSGQSESRSRAIQSALLLQRGRLIRRAK
jgi:hypothetical protein